MIRNIKNWSLQMEDEFKKVISELQRVESQFCRNGFDKEMGKDSTLFLALANTLISAVDDLNNIRSKQKITIEKEVKKRVAKIERQMRDIQDREQKTLEKIQKEIDKDKPKIKVIPKTPKKTTKKAKIKVKDE